MIDDHDHLWLVPASLVAIAFFAGGVMAGARRPRRATTCAAAVAGLANGVLVAGALWRRVWIVHESVPAAVVRLWCSGALATVILSVLGSVLGAAWNHRDRGR